jgi:hypothetical protein
MIACFLRSHEHPKLLLIYLHVPTLGSTRSDSTGLAWDDC